MRWTFLTAGLLAIALAAAAVISTVAVLRYTKNYLSAGERAAKAAYDYYQAASERKGPYATVEFRSMVDRIDDRGVRWLIAGYKTRLAAGEHDSVGLSVLNERGGRDAADFLWERLRDTRKSELERMNLMLMVGGTSGWTSLRKFPLDERFVPLAIGLMSSSDPFDRRGGAGLLGWFSGEASRRKLEHALQNDPSPLVHSAAAKGLGRIGDAKSMTVLKEWLKRQTPRLGPESTATEEAMKAAGRIGRRLEGLPDLTPED